ncbi:glycoside hydrolase family 19 protein [Klebsiella variicola]|nr:glycoside hydrolase family 19 protein [Klebsiella variicola]
MSYFNKYDPVLAATQELKDKAIANGNTQQGDGYKYRGRGCVHLTWKNNYKKAKDKFGIDYVNQPELAADFKHAVPIMIWGMEVGIFTGKNSLHI